MAMEAYSCSGCLWKFMSVYRCFYVFMGVWGYMGIYGWLWELWVPKNILVFMGVFI